MNSKPTKWTEEIILYELNKTCEKLGHFPTASELMKLNKSDLISAISRLSKKENKGFPYFQIKMGYKRKYMPDGYWTEQTILNELKKIIIKNNQIPTNKELRKNEKTKKLLVAMDRKGGKNVFIKKLGLKVNQEKPGFWSEAETLKKLENICEKNGYFPTHKQIRNIGGITLSDMVIKYGGSKKFADKLGFPLAYKGKIDGWTLEDVLQTIREIIIKTGQFPNTTYLQQHGYGGLVAAIYSKFGNLENIAKKLGLETETHTQGYWTEWDNVKKEIEKIIQITKIFPNYQQIKILNSKLTKGIREFGGISEVAKKLGYEPPSQIVALDGHNVRSSYEFFIDNYLYGHGIKHSVDGRINKNFSNYRYDFKIGNFYIEVWGYADTNSSIAKQYNVVKQLKEEFYKSNKLTVISFHPNDFTENQKEIEKIIENRLRQYKIKIGTKRKDYKIENYFEYRGFWTKNHTIEELKKAVKHYGDFPLELQLRKDKKSSLAFAINKHGGVNHFRQLLGFDIKKHNQLFWTEEKIINELKIITDRLGHFPSAQELAKMRESRLSAMIAHKGGFKKFQKILGHSPKHKPDGFYQNKDSILAECERIFLKLGHFPSAQELLELRENTLRGAIGRKGGYAFYKELVKKKYNNNS